MVGIVLASGVEAIAGAEVGVGALGAVMEPAAAVTTYPGKSFPLASLWPRVSNTTIR